MTGAPNRLAEWFHEWHQPLRRFLRRRRAGSVADIEDIAQEVFLRLLRYDRSDLIDHPQAYLYKIAANVSAEWAMRASRSLPHSAEWLGELVDAFNPETAAGHGAAEAELQRAIEALPSRQREIVRLHFGEGMTHEDISGQLGLTRRIVKRDLARAYAALRASLDPDLAKAGLPWPSSGTAL
jgi:RNA polymerase sigma-70 factor (ECF subfamily)